MMTKEEIAKYLNYCFNKKIINKAVFNTYKTYLKQSKYKLTKKDLLILEMLCTSQHLSQAIEKIIAERDIFDKS